MSLSEQVKPRSMDNVLEYLALFITSRLQSLIVFCLTSNDKNGLINVISDKILEKVLSQKNQKLFSLRVKHIYLDIKIYVHLNLYHLKNNS